MSSSASNGHCSRIFLQAREEIARKYGFVYDRHRLTPSGSDGHRCGIRQAYFGD
ncbi:hypothetical protein [Shinella zoogloeoides]|uniref:hypothetical protein n=1 Tax=Shinella zoogloeoides TaxID=352475 RepID=UPI0013C35137|nr:hypothetical protein [Shinella zoogloeoides]